MFEQENNNTIPINEINEGEEVVVGNVETEEKESVLSANFKTLSPTKDADITNYEEALDFVFSNNEIKNVAIAGAYCSGKSSIVETYEEKKKDDYKLLHISLAHFCAINQSEDEKANNETNNVTNKETNNVTNLEIKKETTNKKVSPHNKHKNKIQNRSTIEGKILNQLIQQIPSDRIKQSKFKIKTDFNSEKALWLIALICVSIVLLVHLLKFHSWESFYTNDLKNNAVKVLLYGFSLPDSRILSAFLLLVIFGYFFFKLVYAQYINGFIRKISIQGNKIEIGNESKSSFFDKYLNEVLYIFERVDAKAIVFEDIDRFNDLALFEQLREINTLVNIRKRKNKEEPLRFIYMMRDDLFVDFKDRTKFFDFIIPVIPILDGSNSYSVLKDYLTKDELIGSFDDHFLREISLYIDDCRILKNIHNELLLYNEKLKASKLNLNRLLAIITYKNIFPKDYDELRFNKGCVYSFFAAENKIKEDIRAQNVYDEEIIREKIDTNKEDCQRLLKDLKSKYRLDVKDKDVNDELKIRDEYENKKEKILLEQRTTEKSFYDKLEVIRQERAEIDNMTLTDLLSRYSDFVFNHEYLKSFVKNSPELIKSPYFGLVKFLLSSGYIEASYASYMTYHYEDGMSINDNYFMRSVIERNKLGYGYKIDDPELVVETLKPLYFAQPTTLNYILYNFIFKERKLRQINYAMSLFSSSKRSEYIDFVEGYILEGEKNGDFVKLLAETWNDVFDYAYNNMSIVALEKMCVLILKYCNKDTIRKMTKSQSKLREHISLTSDIFSSEIDSEKLNDILLDLNIRFKTLENMDSETIEFLYDHDLYEINESNISFLLKTKCKVENAGDIYSAFFTFVFSHEQEYRFCNLITRNLDKVLQIYLKVYNRDIEDDSETACDMINWLKNENAVKYINRLKTKIVNIDSIRELEHIQLLAKHKCIEYNSNNVFTWFGKAHGITPEIIEFIDSSDEIIKFDLNNSSIRLFLTSLLNNEQLSNEKYCQIIQNLGDKAISVIRSSQPSEYRMRMLIESKSINISPEITSLIKYSYPKLLELYICNNIDSYFPEKSSELVLQDLRIAILSKQISERKKIELLDKYGIPTSCDSVNYTEDLTKHILEGELYPDDVVCFAQSYSALPNLIKETVYSLLVMDPNQIYRIDKNIDHKLLLYLLSDERIGFSSRVRFLSIHLDNIEKDELNEVLIALGANEIVDHIFKDGKNVNVTENNRIILRLLWEKHIVKYPYKTASGKKYKKIEYIDRAVRPRIPLYSQSGIND